MVDELIERDRERQMRLIPRVEVEVQSRENRPVSPIEEEGMRHVRNGYWLIYDLTILAIQ